MVLPATENFSYSQAARRCQPAGTVLRAGGQVAVRLRVADADAARIRATCASACHADVMRATVVLGVQGRLVLPAEARRELGLAAGDELVLHTEDGRLVLERREDAGERLRGLYASSATRGSVGELLTERRRAASSE